MDVCERVCVRERESERVCVRERESERVCVRERESERVCGRERNGQDETAIQGTNPSLNIIYVRKSKK